MNSSQNTKIVKVKCKDCGLWLEYVAKIQSLIFADYEECAAIDIISKKYACAALPNPIHADTDVCVVKSASRKYSQTIHGELTDIWVEVEMDQDKRHRGTTPPNPKRLI